MVELQSSKLTTRVRFSSPAPRWPDHVRRSRGPCRVAIYRWGPSPQTPRCGGGLGELVLPSRPRRVRSVESVLPVRPRRARSVESVLPGLQSPRCGVSSGLAAQAKGEGEGWFLYG